MIVISKYKQRVLALFGEIRRKYNKLNDGFTSDYHMKMQSLYRKQIIRMLKIMVLTIDK